MTDDERRCAEPHLRCRGDERRGARGLGDGQDGEIVVGIGGDDVGGDRAAVAEDDVDLAPEGDDVERGSDVAREAKTKPAPAPEALSTRTTEAAA